MVDIYHCNVLPRANGLTATVFLQSSGSRLLTRVDILFPRNPEAKVEFHSFDALDRTWIITFEWISPDCSLSTVAFGSEPVDAPGPRYQRPIMVFSRASQSSSGGSSSSRYRTKLTLISVLSCPRSTSLTKCASTCICTISSAPLRTPHSMLEYHSSSCALPSSGSSTKSANGFSSKTKENWLLSLVQLVTCGEMLRNILKPIYSNKS